MKTLSEDSIPFFGYMDNPYGIFIINDRILGFGLHGFFSSRPDKAAYLLWKLMQCKQAKKILPAKLQQIIIGKTYIPEITNPKLFGFEENVAGVIQCFCCFDLDISFDFKQDKPVIFQEMTYLEIPLGRKVFLSLEEAALILANICTAPLMRDYSKKLLTSNTEKQLNEQISFLTKAKHQSKMSQEFLEENNNFNHFEFSVYYFKYIQWLLLEQRINPKLVLNYSGLGILVSLVELPPVFSFLEQVMDSLLHPEGIPEPQLIIYYAFFKLAYKNLKSMKDVQKITILLEFYRKNERLLDLVRSKIRHPLPVYPKNLWKIHSF